MPPRGKATLRDVALRAQVSTATASMILQRKPGVSFSDETVARVLQAANELGYNKPVLKSAFDRPAIAVLIPQITSLYYSFLAQSIEQRANEAGMDTVLFDGHSDSERLLRQMQSVYRLGFAGAILTTPPDMRAASLALELGRKTPTVIIDTYNMDLPLDNVKIDTYRCGVLAAEHLLELGHRDVAFLEIDRWGNSGTCSLRLQGARDCFVRWEDAKLTVYSRPEPHTLRPGSFIETRIMAREMTEEALQNGGHTAFICVSDYCAYGVLDILAARGLRVPEDYSVCACDDIFPSNLPGVSLTSVNRHPEDIGASSFDLLLQRMKSNTPEEKERITHVEYRSSLMVRASTAPPRRA